MNLILSQYHLILQSTSYTSQDIVLNRSLPMKSKSDSVTPNEPQSSRRRISGGKNVSEVFGLPVNANQFSALSENQTAVCQRSTEQREVGLVDPRTTRHLRWSAQQADDNEAKTKQAESATVLSLSNTQGISTSGTNVNPYCIRRLFSILY